MFKYIKIVILGPAIKEKSSSENAMNRCFDFPTFSTKYVFSFDDFSLITGPKTTHFIYLE